jgi:hypothetical protein
MGLRGTTRALWAKCFKGVRLSMPVSAYLREDKIKVSEQNKSKIHDRGSEDESLHFGAHPGLLRRAAR